MNGGKYWSHSAASKKRMSEKAKARWSAMSEKKRATIRKRISKAKKGKIPKLTAKAREARAQKIRAFWATLSPEEKAERVKRATEARRKNLKRKK
jgi:hypothetical protein